MKDICLTFCQFSFHLKERRQKALEEMVRILRPGGRALIYAWAQEQEKDSVPSTYLKPQKSDDVEIKTEKEPESSLVQCEKSDSKFPLVLPVHKNRTNFEHSDLLVPWKTKGANEPVESKTFLRYYHVFREGELEDIILESDKLSTKIKIEESYYDQGNWCVILLKNL